MDLKCYDEKCIKLLRAAIHWHSSGLFLAFDSELSVITLIGLLLCSAIISSRVTDCIACERRCLIDRTILPEIDFHD